MFFPQLHFKMFNLNIDMHFTAAWLFFLNHSPQSGIKKENFEIYPNMQCSLAAMTSNINMYESNKEYLSVYSPL